MFESIIRELRYREDVRTLGFMATYLALVAVGWAVWDGLPLLGKVAWVAITSLFSFFCAVITHNTVHVPPFKKRSWNRVFQYVISCCYGHPVSAFVPGHNLSHHLHTQSRRDVMRSTKVRFRWNLLNQLLFMPVLSRDVSSADWRYAMAMRFERPKWYAQWVREWVFFLSIMGGLLLLDFWKFLFLAMVPHLYAAWGIIGINFIQHDGTDQSHPYNHSRNFIGRFVNWWTFNNGFHGMHHHQPNLHWSLVPAAHFATVAPYIHPSLDQTSLIAYCWRAYGWPGKRLHYDGSPHRLPAEGPDEEWIPGVGDTPLGASLGAEG